jgi:hypothetical protein
MRARLKMCALPVNRLTMPRKSSPSPMGSSAGHACSARCRRISSHDLVEGGMLLVHHRHEKQSGNPARLAVFPDLFSPHLDARRGAQHDYSPIGHPRGGYGVAGEVEVSRRIQQVHLHPVPLRNATEHWTEMPWAISSSVYIVRAVPSFTLPCRREVPVAKQSASTRVVLPEPPWPRTTTLRICSEGRLYRPSSAPPEARYGGEGGCQRRKRLRRVSSPRKQGNPYCV